MSMQKRTADLAPELEALRQRELQILKLLADARSSVPSGNSEPFAGGVITHSPAEESYRAFIHNSSEGMWRMELDQPIDSGWPEDEQLARIYEWGYLAECNPATARMYGYDAQHHPLTGARLSDFLVRSNASNEAFLRSFIRSGYELREGESHEQEHDGNDRYFARSLVGVKQEGRLSARGGHSATSPRANRLRRRCV